MSGRLSWPDLAEAMALMTSNTSDANSLAMHFDVDDETMRFNLRMLHGAKLVRVVKWKASGRGSHNWTAMYTRGSGNDVPRPAFGQKSYVPMRPSAHIIAFASMWRELERTAHCPKSLAQACGTHHNRVYLLMARMRELGLLDFAGTTPSRKQLGGKPSTLWRLCELDAGPAIYTPERWRYEQIHAAKPRCANSTHFTEAA